ncbi:hypothetical protein [Achromobacter sp.]|uniref:hypothetical protein n=1 Tax=Achromobacter sp. TaxID=134375 RepID=UPI000EDD8FFD|nr:hypothetical protein [Achromobacter sp.]HCW16867.1 hypothetical protein [Achromobacter sp.]
MRAIAWAMAMAISSPAASADLKPTLTYDYETVENAPPRAIVSGLVNMDEIFDGCGQRVGRIKVGGIQFSPSGNTLESFWFVDKNGAQWSVPTNISALASTADQAKARSFIKVGQSYWAHVQLCGTGAFASLISLYDMRIEFGTK